MKMIAHSQLAKPRVTGPFVWSDAGSMSSDSAWLTDLMHRKVDEGNSKITREFLRRAGSTCREDRSTAD